MIILSILNFLCDILTLAILMRGILSWLKVSPRNPIFIIVYRTTEPLLVPLRRIVPRIGMLNIAPLVAILLLQFISSFISSLSP